MSEHEVVLGERVGLFELEHDAIVQLVLESVRELDELVDASLLLLAAQRLVAEGASRLVQLARLIAQLLAHLLQQRPGQLLRSVDELLDVGQVRAVAVVVIATICRWRRRQVGVQMLSEIEHGLVYGEQRSGFVVGQHVLHRLHHLTTLSGERCVALVGGGECLVQLELDVNDGVEKRFEVRLRLLERANGELDAHLANLAQRVHHSALCALRLLLLLLLLAPTLAFEYDLIELLEALVELAESLDADAFDVVAQLCENSPRFAQQLAVSCVVGEQLVDQEALHLLDSH